MQQFFIGAHNSSGTNNNNRDVAYIATLATSPYKTSLALEANRASEVNIRVSRG